jgi:hypothetical protein
MTNAGTFAKIDGDILYGADINAAFSNSAESLVSLWQLDTMVSGVWTPTLNKSLSNIFKNTYWDALVSGNKISSVSTGSFISGGGVGANYYTANTYIAGSPGNPGFESAIASGLNNWWVVSGCTDESSTFIIGSSNAWASKTGGLSLVIIGSFGNGTPGGSAFASQLIDASNICGIQFNEGYNVTEAYTLLRIYLGGSVISQQHAAGESGQNLNYKINVPYGFTGSKVLMFHMIGGTDMDSSRNAIWYIDEVKTIRYTSGNLIPDVLVSSGLAAQTNKSFKAGYFLVNGSAFPAGTNGSYYLSANSGTNWDAVANGQAVTFTVPGTVGKSKIELYSSGGMTPTIYQYGFTMAQS